MNDLETSNPLTINAPLLRWVKKMVTLCKPDHIHWVDGSQEEYDRLCSDMVESGTLIRLNEEKWPGCFLARSDASDVARVEDRTFICSNSKDGAGPTNNWENPFEMKKKLQSALSDTVNVHKQQKQQLKVLDENEKKMVLDESKQIIQM